MATREQGTTPNKSFVTEGSVTYTNQSTQRRVGSDRSDLKQQNQIRNVRTSTMPGSRRNELGSARKTTDQTFSDSYAKKGLQPSSLTEDIGEEYSAGRRYESIEQLSREPIPEEMAELYSIEEQIFDEEEYEEGEEAPIRAKKIRGKKSKLSKAKNTLARAKARTVNTGIWSWGIYSWLFFQLPFAVLGLILLAVAVAVENLVMSVSIPEEDDGILVSLAKGAVNTIVQGIASVAKLVNDTVLKVFDVDLSAFNPASFFIVPYGLVLAYGIILLLLMYLIYKLAFLNPLSGSGGGAKKGALLLAIIGYSVPGLNLFPWFLVWTLVVLRYPK